MPEIRVDFIAPFIKAAVKTFQNMMSLNVVVQREKVKIKHGYLMSGEISGIIGMTGATTGTCALSMNEPLATDCIERMLGEKVEGGIHDPVTHDGIGELVNMIAGHAKALLEGVKDPVSGQQKYRFSITLPTIISGSSHELYQKSGTICVVIPFMTETNQLFTLEVSVVDVK